jgi:hypothetical protein
VTQAVPLQCPRCGFYPVVEVDICWACADGMADAGRARRLIEAAANEVAGASRILQQVSDRRALPAILGALASGMVGRARRALISAAGFAGRNDAAAVEALTAELWNTDLELSGEAVDALADSTANPVKVSDALATVMVARTELEIQAALSLAWRRDERALTILEHHLSTRGSFGAHNLNRAPGPMLGRLGQPGQAVLARLLVRAVAAQPEPPIQWSPPDQLVRELIDGLIGRYGLPDPEGEVAARQAVAGCNWAMVRLDGSLAELEGRPFPGAPPATPIEPSARVVPRWGMRLRRVEHGPPGPVTRFGGQPYFPNEAVWPLHPANRLPLSFLCQIAVPAVVMGDGTWLAHVFVDVAAKNFVDDPEYDYPVPASAVIVHPAGRWWGPTQKMQAGPTYPYEWPDEWPSPDPVRDRFRVGRQYGFVVSEVDLVPGADPVSWPSGEPFEITNDDWNKVGGTPLTLQGGEDRLQSRGWKFLASFDAGWAGHEMGDAAHCCIWLHADGRGFLDVQSH